jgi:hypothetical protein
LRRLILCCHLERYYAAKDGAQEKSSDSRGPFQFHDCLALEGTTGHFTS